MKTKKLILVTFILIIISGCSKVVDAIRGDLRSVVLNVEASSSNVTITDFYYRDDNKLNTISSVSTPWE